MADKPKTTDEVVAYGKQLDAKRRMMDILGLPGGWMESFPEMVPPQLDALSADDLAALSEAKRIIEITGPAGAAGVARDANSSLTEQMGVPNVPPADVLYKDGVAIGTPAAKPSNIGAFPMPKPNGLAQAERLRMLAEALGLPQGVTK